jgi:hypothetical protein
MYAKYGRLTVATGRNLATCRALLMSVKGMSWQPRGAPGGVAAAHESTDQPLPVVLR